MERRDFLRSVLAGGAALSMPARADIPNVSRPNILFIMADDHTKAAMSCYGSKTIQTPHLDRLASQGMRFNHMTATNSLCAPSRATLLTGKYSHVNGFTKNHDRFDGAQQTFPKLLQSAGYETALIGKWHLATEPTGFDDYLVLPGQGRYFDCPLKAKGDTWQEGNAGGTVYPGYLTDVITDQSIHWLRERHSEKPFCLMVHHKAPHGPHDPAPRRETLFESVDIPEPPTLLDDYAGRAPESIADRLESSRMAICRYPQYKQDIAKFAGDREKATRYMYQTYMKGYLRLVAALDENMGRLLDYLDASGLSENTLVVYTSDNGFFNGEHGFFNKMWMYEPSLHLPMLVRYPGVVQPETTNDALVSMLDWAPTFLELAGAPIPEDLQGASMCSLLRGENPAWRDAIYYHYYGEYNVPENYGVRTQTHKLIHYPALEEGAPWELFDLTRDPQELKNLAGDPAHAALLKALKRLLQEKRATLGDTT